MPLFFRDRSIASRGPRLVAGFSLTEALISVSIVAIISMITIFDLQASRRHDELNTGTRVIAGDLRSLQARALTGKNLKYCVDGTGVTISCELSVAGCATSCTEAPPAGVGAHFDTNVGRYTFYSKADLATTDWRKTSAGEVFFTRDLSTDGAPNIVISSIEGAGPMTAADVAFQRQNGSMRLNACTACTEDSSIKITLRHAQSGETKRILVNAVTGRISVE